jgi:hypothetical protein
MCDGVEFRKRARRCVEQANAPGLPRSEQAIVLRMAATWVKFAEDVP